MNAAMTEILFSFKAYARISDKQPDNSGADSEGVL